MALATQLSNRYAELNSAPSDIKDPIITAKDNLNASFDTSRVIKKGETLPAFSLPDATGNIISSADLLKKSPLLVTFYRGEWCPFCNEALIALQKHVDEYHSRGAQFVAISPELPNSSLSVTEKHNLKFPVLSDRGNEYARKLGIVFKQSDTVRQPFNALGIDLNARNGDDSFELPIPLTVLVDRDATVRNVYVNPDFTKRLEPEEAIRWIDDFNAEK